MSIDFEILVRDYYQALYRFGLSLACNSADACDLTQQTFALWADRGHQLRDSSKVKTWLFTTLYREFLATRRKAVRFPQHELSEVESELPVQDPRQIERLSGREVMEALEQVDDIFRTPLVLFYVDDNSYSDIAAILDIPIGTVMSRISRGKQQLRALISGQTAEQAQRARTKAREEQVS